MSKPLPILEHMPRHVKEKIVDRTDTSTKFVLLRCSKDYHSIVSQSRIKYDSVSFKVINEKKIQLELSIDNYTRTYTYECYPHNQVMKSGYGLHPKLLKDTDFVDEAVKMLMKMLRFPNIVMKNFTVKIEGNCIRETYSQALKNRILTTLEANLSSFTQKLHVTYLELKVDPCQEDILRILPHLKPGILKTISLIARIGSLHHSVHFPDLSRVVQLPQWKEATSLCLWQYRISYDHPDTNHFAKVLADGDLMSLEEFKNMINKFLCKDGWANRTFYFIHSDFAHAPIYEYLSRFEKTPRGLFRIERNGVQCVVCFQNNNMAISNPEKDKRYSRS